MNLNTTTLHYFIPYAIGASASTRVSNELGAGNPKTAKGAVRVVVIIGIAEAIIVSTFFICFRNILGYAYSNDEQVVNYIADMVPLLCVSVSADSLIGALSGVARGGGFQQMGAYVNLGAYYLVGIPLGSVLNVIILATVTALTDWQKEATKARERIVDQSIKNSNNSNTLVVVA
ncbi:MATE efflux family protein 8-like [Trifolium pratense]|uniref:MATE efflux family protein 8-like n=2 Tax=Trifolium TaxID=3898 RepID=A0A2K3L711_TRIPR|nr:MATE efflux family protein 8-like [Trifolium pratense]